MVLFKYCISTVQVLSRCSPLTFFDRYRPHVGSIVMLTRPMSKQMFEHFQDVPVYSGMAKRRLCMSAPQ